MHSKSCSEPRAAELLYDLVDASLISSLADQSAQIRLVKLPVPNRRRPYQCSKFNLYWISWNGLLRR